jgi:hypothetical protein
VQDLLEEKLGDRLGEPSPVEVSLGGPRGLRVTVTVPDDEVADEVQGLLSAQLFETVTVVSPMPGAVRP